MPWEELLFWSIVTFLPFIAIGIGLAFWTLIKMFSKTPEGVIRVKAVEPVSAGQLVGYAEEEA